MKYTKTFEVRFTETDRQGEATAVAMFNYLQETALGHGNAVGLSPEELAADHYGWMMNRLHLRIYRYPKRDEVIEAMTWGSNLKGLFAVREWEIRDGDGAIIAAATGRWVFLDFVKKKILRLPEFLAERYGEHAERGLDDDFARVHPVECEAFERHFHVRASDLDTNQHANSACYIDWALEAVPTDLLLEGKPREIELTYKKETVLGDGLVARSRRDDDRDGCPAFHHTITKEGSGEVLAFGRSLWTMPKESPQ